MIIQRYTEGIMGDGAAILCDGVLVPVDVVVSHLNNQEAEIEELVDIVCQYSLNACALGISHPHLAPDIGLEERAKKAVQKHKGKVK